MNFTLYKEDAEDLMNSLYRDCLNFEEWDTTDEDNWNSMCDIIEKLAEHFDLKLEDKKEKDNA